MSRAALRHLGWALLAWVAACGSSAGTGPEPEVSLATTAAAQGEFRELRQQWVASPLDARVNLERVLTDFVQRHPTDPQGRLARIYLAWISVQRGQLDVADRWLSLAEPGSAGTAADLLDVVRASLSLSRGKAEEAYQSLVAIQGRLIDEDDRLLCLDQLVAAALASGRYREANRHILDLAAHAARRHRERMWRTLEPRLASIPLPVLEESLTTLSEASVASASVRPAERAAAVDWMRRQILDLLSRSALEQRDVGLAQRLMAAPRSSADDRAKAELLLLATQGGRAPVALGRTLGLALQTENAEERQRAMDVASGIALTLELAQRSEGGQQVTLLTREVEGDAVGETLARLAAEGATLLAAGFDARSAGAAAAYAAQHGVPTLLLHEPDAGSGELAPQAYVLGTDEAKANEVLRQPLSARGVTLVRVGSEEVPCAGPGRPEAVERATSLGKRLALIFEGSAHCAESVLMGLGTRPAAVGLGLGALVALNRDIAADELWAVGVGRLPSFDGAREEALLRWYQSKGRAPGWYEALGHDAARLAEAVLPRAPESVAREARDVSEVHRSVARALALAAVNDLWTSSTNQFDGARRLTRTFRPIRLAPRANGAEAR